MKMKSVFLVIVLIQIAQTFGDHVRGPPELKRYYMLSAFKANWYQANAHCHSMDMQLVSIESKEESERIISRIKQKGHNKESFWTSGTRLGNNGTFYWFGNGDKFVYTDWAKNQPDNKSDVKGQEEECVAMENFSEFKWNDCYCLRQLYFICERYLF